jgi:hypothetical protein
LKLLSGNLFTPLESFPRHGFVRIGEHGGKSSPVFAENRGQIDANWSADGQRMVFGYVVGATNLNISLLDLKAHKLVTPPARN